MMSAFAEVIRQKYALVRRQIDQAAQSVSRRPEDVHLVVVTKAQPVEVVQAAVAAGAQILGENYPEEAAVKIKALTQKDDLAWHMIGHLQSRKAGLIVEDFDVLESLDSLHLARKLERLLVEKERQLPVFLEVNVSGEQSKNGLAGWEESHWDRLIPEVEEIMLLQHLSVQGLMTMPPLFDDPELSRPFFARLHRLADFLSHRYGSQHFQELSMGTSMDFQTAVQEGATYVRVGTAIVGPRPAK